MRAGYVPIMYDIIGDIHGHADELVQLLTTLGYHDGNDCFRHTSRKVIFCGDFIDRGPQIPDAVRIAKSMVEGDAALAVMGNHEFNALAFHTEDPKVPGSYLRPHTPQNNHQHQKTLEQFADDDLSADLEWFGTLPTSLDLGGLRVVHACWESTGIQTIQDALSDLPSAFSPDFLAPATTKTDPLFHAVERILKGPELPLPQGETVTDKEGNVRRRIRIRWFEAADEHCWNTYSLPTKPSLPATSVPADSPAAPYPTDAPPVFVGHYWLPDSVPSPLSHNVACLDYSVAKNGFLTAYRFDGEARLSAERFVSVPSRDRGANT